MTSFTTAYINGDNFSLDVNITKVNVEKRTVSGFASLDNLDLQDHVVPIEASRKAFSRWRRNIREMHQPKAVGKAVDIQERKYVDPTSGKEYDGIYISAYVSRGAEDTWQKVLDGTLTGFSIGGAIRDKMEMYDPEINRVVTKIIDFDLHEVSLVDTPANPLANILSISKSEDGSIIGASGIATLVKDISNVHFCQPCDIALMSDLDVSECPTCDDNMQNVGWVENTEGKEEAIQKMVAPLRAGVSEILESAGVEEQDSDNTETGGVNVSENVEKTVVAEVEEAVETVEEAEATVEEVEAVTEEVEATEEVEKAAEVSEVQAVEDAPSLDEIAKRLDELAKSLSELKSFMVKDVPLDPAEPSLDVQQHGQDKGQSEARGLKKDAEGETTETEDEPITKALGAITEGLEGVSNKLTSFEERLVAIEEGGAVKKSGEVVEKQQKQGVWNGAFAPTFYSAEEL